MNKVMKFQIKCRITAKVLFEIETETMKMAVEAAIKAKADLSSADLSSADLSLIKKDFLRVISAMKNEVIGLYKSMLDGKIDGSKYEGECACLKGTLAKVNGCKLDGLNKFEIKCDSSDPSERWFMGISPGDTPDNNSVSKITVEWIKEFCAEQGIALPVLEIVWK